MSDPHDALTREVDPISHGYDFAGVLIMHLRSPHPRPNALHQTSQLSSQMGRTNHRAIRAHTATQLGLRVHARKDHCRCGCGGESKIFDGATRDVA